MSNFDEKAIIGRIIELRKGFAGVRGKSKFAKLLGISASTYSYYENDRVPPIAVLLKICEVTCSWSRESSVIKADFFKLSSS